MTVENISEEVFIEGEFNCFQCDFQGTQQSQLSKHIQLKHSIQCRNCDKFFRSKPELMVHRKTEHYGTVAPCKKGSSCEFTERCWWKHKKMVSKDIECYFCEDSFETKAQVMLHRKANHTKTVKNCTKFENESCTKNEETCWFMHKTREKETEKEKEEHKDITENNLVFWKRQNNLKNP